MKPNTTLIYRVVKDFVIRQRRIVNILLFLLQAALANYLAFVVRFESKLTEEYLLTFLTYLPLLLIIRLVTYLQGGLYKGLLRYASISDLIKIISSTTLGSIAFLVVVHYLIGDTQYPRSVVVLDWLLCVALVGGTRFFIRVFNEYMFEQPACKRMLIVGAGDAGEMIVREMRNSQRCEYTPIGFIDDDVQNKGLTIHDVPILGTSDMIPHIVRKHKPDELLISTTDTNKSIGEIYELCKPFNIPIKKLPGINDLLGGQIPVAEKIGQRLVESSLVTETQVREALELQRKEGGRLGSKLVKLGYISEESLVSVLTRDYGISHIKPISLEDLLQREQVKTDITSVRDFIEERVVLVTGAGGSIGSELCRQIARYRPSQLILLDRYENSLYEVDRKLRAENPGRRISTITADIQDRMYIEHIFAGYRPQIVFHAAAYKHVPLMEQSPLEAVKNNVFGTKNLLDISSRYGAESFVQVSTDKAVNPTSVMGVTKRVAEFLTLHMNGVSETKFTTVRFGNVLGSNGSVVPIFKELLKRGGPLTVTHPEIKRFFMLIPEAVQLVLIAAAAGEGGEIFVLDMGEPVRIVDLAENFIRLSGFVPNKEIKIVFTGLRPGEKLYEELFDETEEVLPTFHRKLMKAVPQAPAMTELAYYVSDLDRAVKNCAVCDIVPILQRIVPNFTNDVAVGDPLNVQENVR